MFNLSLLSSCIFLSLTFCRSLDHFGDCSKTTFYIFYSICFMVSISVSKVFTFVSSFHENSSLFTGQVLIKRNRQIINGFNFLNFFIL